MGFQKKSGKGRIDKWYRLAKEKGYRARAAFKLVQLNRKYGFLEQTRVCLDLCAAPGSWCQVAAEVIPAKGSMILGIDLVPIKPIPKVITFQSDISSDKCRALIRQNLKSLKADTVLHDGAPNVGAAWVQDAFSQAELVLQALKLACEFLVEGGTFVTKVFRSKDYTALLWIFNQLFERVEATKPPSSRIVSAEIFVVCCGFKAPSKIDPKLLDPCSAFAEIQGSTVQAEATVFRPELKRRKREGYGDGEYTQFKETSALEFVTSNDPIAMLSNFNRLTFSRASDSLETAEDALEALPETTEEIKACCKDLKVLGRRDFKSLLKWRLKARDVFGVLSTAVSPITRNSEAAVSIQEIEGEDESLKTIETRYRMRNRRIERKDRERQKREVLRMQLNMITPTDIGLEQNGQALPTALSRFSKVHNSGFVLAGSECDVAPPENESIESDVEETSMGSHEEDDFLEHQLDTLYEMTSIARRQAATLDRSATSFRNQEFHGFVKSSMHQSPGNEDMERVYRLDLKPDVPISELSTKALQFFNNEEFVSIDSSESPTVKAPIHKKSSNFITTPLRKSVSVRQRGSPEEQDLDIQNSDESSCYKVSRMGVMDHESSSGEDIEIVTAEAMTLAQQVALGQKQIQTVHDETFNKYSFRDKDGLPEWFLNDERQHSHPIRSITAAGAQAIKDKERALNARPIKKVKEAKDRKKYRTAKRLEKLCKKSALLAEEEGVSEKDKAANIAKLLRRAGKTRPKQQVRLVVARGGNRGISGRPKGVKGKYKIVDKRLKKDTRAEKRLARNGNRRT